MPMLIRLLLWPSRAYFRVYLLNESCKHVSEWDPAEPDENVDYYKARLQDLYEKFRPFVAEDE